MAAGAAVGLFLYEVVDAGVAWSIVAGLFTWETLQPVPWSWFPGSSWGPAGCTEREFNVGAHFPKGFNRSSDHAVGVVATVLTLKYVVTGLVGILLVVYTDRGGFPSLSDIGQDLSLGRFYLVVPCIPLGEGFRRIITLRMRVDSDSDAS